MKCSNSKSNPKSNPKSYRSGRLQGRTERVSALRWGIHPIVLGSSVVAACLLFIEMPKTGASRPMEAISCETIVQKDASLSRQQLALFLTIPERSSRHRVQEVVRQPHCRLSSLEVRSGVRSTREVYPLQFDPKNWLVILYEGEEYAGYRIAPR